MRFQSYTCQQLTESGYTADVLQNAQSLSDHASRPGPGKIEKEDIELAISLRKRYEFFEAPPRDVSTQSKRIKIIPLT